MKFSLKLITVNLLALGLLTTSALADDRLDTLALKAFLDSQTELKKTLESFCTTESTSTEVVIEQWRTTAVNWYRVQALQLPATEFMQTEFSFIFWPDPKDRLKKQVLAASLTKPDDNDWADLPASTKSLSAIEFLLTTEQPKQHCDWYAAIMLVQLKQANELAALQAFYDFGDIEQITALHGTALTLHSQLKEVLSRPDKPRWVFAPGWRTDTGPLVQTAFLEQINSLLTVFRARHKDITDWKSQLTTLPVLTSDSSRAQVETVNNYAQALAQFVESDLAPSLDIYLGFNNFDGD